MLSKQKKHAVLLLGWVFLTNFAEELDCKKNNHAKNSIFPHSTSYGLFYRL